MKVSLGIVQQIMDAMFSNLDFAVTYLDDILIKSRNRKEHAKHVKFVFKKNKDYSYKLSIDECDFFNNN